MTGVSIDPEAQAWLDSVPRRDPDLPPITLEELRAWGDFWPYLSRPPIHAVSDHLAEADGLDVPVRLYRPSPERGLPVVVYLHGGGWVAGGIELTDGICRRLADQVGAVVVSVGYRLAPEHPFPEPLDDVVAVIRWVANQADQLAVDGTRLAVMGESAGGNLAAAAAIRVNDEGGPELCQQVLLYPITDHDFERPSMLASSEETGLTRQSVMWFWDLYVPDPSQRDDPLVAPARAPLDRLRGVAPAVIVTAGFDPLCDEGDAYALRLVEAGVPVAHLRYPTMIHGFVALAEVVTIGEAALNTVTGLVQSALGLSPDC
jgi:acetyl esterase